MKKSFCALVFSLSSAAAINAQAPDIEPTPTPVRLVVTNTMPPIKPPSTPRPVPTPIIVPSAPRTSAPVKSVDEEPDAPEVDVPIGQPAAASSTPGARTLTFRQMKSMIAEARRQMMTRPLATAATEGAVPTDFVRVAFHDWKTGQLDYVVLLKESFLSTNGDKQTTSQNGRQLTIRTIRGNGVNTPVVFIDETGATHQPLLVQYPVERGGKY